MKTTELLLLNKKIASQVTTSIYKCVSGRSTERAEVQATGGWRRTTE
jgi:hypothetical protein